MMGFLQNQLSKTYYKNYLPRKYKGALLSRLTWFKENETKNREYIRNINWSLRKDLLLHAVQTVPYYQRKFQEAGIRPADIQTEQDWIKIPILTREIIQDEIGNMLARDVDRSHLYHSKTSGSTGQPTTYYHDQEYLERSNALMLRNESWTGWKYGESWLRLWGAGINHTRKDLMRENLTNYLRKITFISTYEMNEENILTWLKMVQKIRPVVIEGYAVVLATLSQFAREKRLVMNDLGIRAVVSSAEVLQDWQRVLVEETFGCKVLNRYGSRELSTLAHECQYGKLHINEDWVTVEIVDALGKPVPRGQSGQVVVTGLNNYCMPYIRYSLQDVATFPEDDEPCECGRPFHSLIRIEGRIQDMIALPGGGYLTGYYLGSLLKQYDLMKYQVIQSTLTKLEVLLVPGQNFLLHDLEASKPNLAHMLPGIQVSYRLVDDIRPTTAGKYRYVISQVARADLFHRPTGPDNPPENTQG